MTKLPVIAAIPNYNMANELKRLLPELLKHGYSQVYVLDDASTDNSREVVTSFKNVKFISGKQNKGAGANRNRILKEIKEDVIIHFLDADIKLETPNTADKIRELLPDDDFGFIGGLALSTNGLQSIWNYGPRSSPRTEIGAFIQMRTEKLLINNPRLYRRIRNIFNLFLTGWPDPLAKPTKKEVYWCVEQNLIIKSKIFKKLGGFDESLRETEILELAIRTHKLGLKSYFDPAIAIRHTEGNVRAYNRPLRKAREWYRISFRYGIFNWLFGRQ